MLFGLPLRKTTGVVASLLKLPGLDATGIRPVIDCSFALDEIADAFRHEESGARFGKIVLSI